MRSDGANALSFAFDVAQQLKSARHDRHATTDRTSPSNPFRPLNTLGNNSSAAGVTVKDGAGCGIRTHGVEFQLTKLALSTTERTRQSIDQVRTL